MDHQVQMNVLVDGEWVSRQVDVFQAMAHARSHDSEPPEDTAPTIHHVPKIGVLSRTVLASPVVKFIHAANIRHKHFDDVVLVGEDSVQLKEIHDYGHLRHVAIKADFNGRIMASRVFGDPRQLPTRVVSPLPAKRTLHRARRSTTGEERFILPPEVIVLTLTTRTLMFLWAQHTHFGAVTFSQKTVKLPAGASAMDRFGAFLAIDPKRRAMAVAAPEGRFILYKTKQMEDWRRELSDGHETSPIEDERIIAIDGCIMHMEFLSSGGGHDDSHVVLVFIVAHHGRTKVTCFDWDCRLDLGTATARIEKVVLDFEDHSPSLLIPLLRTPDFLLVFDEHITICTNVLSGVPGRVSTPIAAPIRPSLLPGDSRFRPRWVAWDRAPRNPEFPKEAFYVAREDGRILYAERSAEGIDQEEAGEWPYRVDTAFAFISVDNSEFSHQFPDVLIAGGIGNDGLLCKVGSWPAESPFASSYSSTNQLTYVEPIPNWTPLTDLSVTQLPGVRVPHERERSSIIIANGSAPHGEVSELRYGLQAVIDDSFGGMDNCTGMWALDHGSHMVDVNGRTATQHYATFAITLPPQTLLIRITRTHRDSAQNAPATSKEGTWNAIQIPTGNDPISDGVVRDAETLSACVLSEHFALQVTRKGANILHRPDLNCHDSTTYENSILVTASRPGSSLIAIAVREYHFQASEDAFLEVKEVGHDGHFINTVPRPNRTPLSSDPSCIELIDIEGQACVLVGTFDSELSIFKVNNNRTLSNIFAEGLENAIAGERQLLLESAVLLTGRDTSMLVCATRNGYLLYSQLMNRGLDDYYVVWKVYKMGVTAARITADPNDTSTAFVTCGSDFCQVRCSADASVLDVQSIWFANRSEPGYLQAPVTAMYQMPFANSTTAGGRDLGSFLFTIAGDRLLFSQLDIDTGRSSNDIPAPPNDYCCTVPRKIHTGGKPTNLLYIKALRKMVISTMEPKEGKAPPNGYRALHPTVKLLNVNDDKSLDEVEVKQEHGEDFASSLVTAELVLQHGERVYSIAEWFFNDHMKNKKHTLVIVATGVRGSHGEEKGRRLILSPGKHGTKLQLQKESTFDHPVYCTAVYSNEITISAIGKTLTLDVFDSEAGSIKKHGIINLPSPGIHITIHHPYIYVSTLQHSHFCFEVALANNGDYEFCRVFTDSRERLCASHLVLDLPSSNPTTDLDTTSQKDTIVLVTDKRSASLSALYQHPIRTHKNAAPTLFEASLPHTVVRLQRGDIRPPWRRPATSSAPPTGVMVDDIIGACSEGTIYSFSILSESTRHLLRLLQNLIEEKAKRDPRNQYTIVRQRTGDIKDILMHGAEGAQEEKIRVLEVDPRRRGEAGKRMGHVDGDLLTRWRDNGGDLKSLVRDGTERGVGVLFEDFAREALGTEEGNSVEMVGMWLDEILMPIL